MRILPFLHSMPLPMFEDEQGGNQGGDEAAAAAAAAAAKGKAAPNVLDGGLDDKNVQTPGDWPEDWRARIAGDDADAVKRLERFKAPGDIFKSYRELEARVSKGAKPADIPPPDGKEDPDGLKAWREERGIPASPTDYKLPDTIEKLVTEEDRPALDAFLESMHGKNMPPAAVNSALEFYYEARDAELAAELEGDRSAAEGTADELRKEWGVEFKPLSTVAARFAKEMTPGIDWYQARMPDGRLLANVPEVVKALADLGMQKYGDVSYAGAEAEAKTSTRKAEIQKVMQTDFNAYQNDKEMQAEYFAIKQAEEKRGGR